MDDKFLVLSQPVYDYTLRQRSDANAPLLRELREETAALGEIRDMQISPEQGAFMQLLVAATGAKHAIEIGTFTGYSALCIARGLPPDGRLLCLDVSDEWTSVGRRYWERAGLASKIELRLGPALDSLQALSDGQSLDFAFIDADKGNYDNYYEALLPHMRQGALLLFDNMLRGGRLADPELASDDDIALDALNRKLASDDRVETVLLPFSDGIQFCRKK